MPRVQRSVLVPFAASQMFELVKDVESYPQFLPWCEAAALEAPEAGRTLGTLHINARGIKQQFTTENTLEPPERLVMSLVSGPFRRLEGVWEFTTLDEYATRVSLDVEFETSGGLVGMLVSPVFGDILSSLVDAFVKRAGVLYADDV
jgi:ribosome-associated toxin RatA of RatAB toxin-antitoxin module